MNPYFFVTEQVAPIAGKNASVGLQNLKHKQRHLGTLSIWHPSIDAARDRDALVMEPRSGASTRSRSTPLILIFCLPTFGARLGLISTCFWLPNSIGASPQSAF